VDHRSHADDTGLNAGEKAAATRAARYGDELHFADGDKAAAVEAYQKTQMGKATPQNDGARADHPLSNQKHKNRQKGQEADADYNEEEEEADE
jgi:hypothetical protein